MSTRPLDAMLGESAFGTGKAPMVNPVMGGQNGWAPVIRELTNNQAYMRGQLRCVLLQAPKFFTLMKDPQVWVNTLKAMVEIHAKTIEGLRADLKAEFEEHNVGGAGEVQHELSNMTQERSEPSFTWIDKYGRPFQTMLYYWMTYGMMDPNAKIALVHTLTGVTLPEDYLHDWFSMSCLFFETDPTGRKVSKSWVTVNMMPRESGPIEGKFDLSSPREMLTLTIPFTGTSQFNMGGDLFAQQILDRINLENAVPLLRPAPFDDIEADVQGGPSGIKENIEQLAAEAVPGLN